jgi:ubiquinone/menaquinone biosynthesis C-methylase UbiE
VKPQALREMWGVLKPGGRLVVSDCAIPRSLLGLIASIPMRLNFYEYVRSQLQGELERLVEAEPGEPMDIVGLFLGYIPILRVYKPR